VAATRQDRIVVARLAGTASRHARGRDLTQAEHDRAVAELVEIAAGRADLLAEWAGLAAGSSEDSPDEAVHLQAAQLYRRWRRQGPDPRLDRGRPPPHSCSQAAAQAIRQRVPGNGDGLMDRSQ
jgi:NAD(P)-dependent dehydrogenase (short-subunit alcohol dehydrogenase family)